MPPPLNKTIGYIKQNFNVNVNRDVNVARCHHMQNRLLKIYAMGKMVCDSGKGDHGERSKNWPDGGSKAVLSMSIG